MKKQKNFKEKGITLIALVLTIIILLILAGVSLNLIMGNEGIIGRSEYAVKETEKQIATEKMDLKINSVIIECVDQNGKMPTLQELADVLCENEDGELEYLILKSQAQSALPGVTIELPDETLLTKLIDYPYEFEIDGEFEIIKVNDKETEKDDDDDEKEEENVKVQYTVTLDANGGNCDTPNVKIEEGNPYGTLPQATQGGYTFLGWYTATENGKLVKETDSVTEDVTLYAIWEINVEENESLIGYAARIEKSGEQKIVVNGKIGDVEESVTYNVNAIVCNEDIVLDGQNTIEGATLVDTTYEFGDATKDVATATENAKNMVIFKVNGDLTINEGVTLTACKSDGGYGGPKGMLIYCTGTLTNNGTISMTARGAKAEGQNVYLWKNSDESYEYVPAVGANGGDSHTTSGKSVYSMGKTGYNGTDRRTGGGGSGGAYHGPNEGYAYVYRGGNGTSYSGGTGSGGINENCTTGPTNSRQASDIGGTGRNW